ncbi:MAG: enoyl-CoA hydratase-related protein [Planctomycetota bacterium]|nr:enoyl-CoA hydratase-related protein [Planctomycetota bacterium]
MVIFNSNTVRIEKDQDGTIMIVLDVKGESANKVNLSLLRDLDAGLDKLEDIPSIPIITLRSGKTSGFAFGPDLHEWQQLQANGNIKYWQEEGMRVYKKLRDLKAPTIAAISGPCLGAGLELALACDYRLVYERPNTIFAFPEVELGGCPAFGSIYSLAKIIGLEKTTKLVVFGARWKAREIFLNRLADGIAQTESQLRSEFTRLMGIALNEGKKNNRTSAPVSLRSMLFEKNFAGRAILNRAFNRIIEKNTPEEIQAPRQTLNLVSNLVTLKSSAIAEQKIAELSQRLIPSPTCKNLVKFALEDISRIPAAPVETPTPNRVALIGEGKTVAEWAFLHASRGIPVSIQGKTAEGLGNTLLALNRLMHETIRKGIWNAVEVEKRLSLVDGTTHATFKEKPDIAILTAHSFFSATDIDLFKNNYPDCMVIKSKETDPWQGEDACLFQQYPLGRFPCCELVIPETSSLIKRDFLLAWISRLGKTAVTISNTKSSIATKVLLSGFQENVELLAEGVSLEKIENSLRKWGFQFGPLFWADWLGLDLISKLFVLRYPIETETHELFSQMRTRSWLGIEEGKGWFLHHKNSWWPNLLAQNLTKHTLKRRTDSLSNSMGKVNQVREGRERILFTMLLEFTNIREDHVFKTEADLNFLAVRAMGWPAHTGGPGPWIRLKGQDYWEALSANYVSRFGRRFVLPKSWNLWFD